MLETSPIHFLVDAIAMARSAKSRWSSVEMEQRREGFLVAGFGDGDAPGEEGGVVDGDVDGAFVVRV
jgi:hypothetical protein